MNKTVLIKSWERFTKKNDFILNPNRGLVEGVADGVLELEKKHGLKLCPCRLRDGTRKRDLKLICPCNFKIQKNWIKQNRCWCGLFVRRK